MQRSDFDRLVEQAWRRIPRRFRRRVENVAIVIEDEPSPALLHSLGLSPQRDTLFGLYQGVPLHRRGAAYGGALPDKISIFYGPLRRACLTPERIRTQVRKTVIHEIGHFFGLDDKTIRALGY